MITPTAAQERIRAHAGLDLLVIAPAGCGKTEALALRIHGLLERGTTTPPQRVLVTTFSNRARDNIRERLGSYLTASKLREHVTISNFHGFSARVFRAHAAVIRLDPAMTIPESDWVGEQCRSRGLDFKTSRAVQEELRISKQELRDDDAVERSLLDSGADLALEIEHQRLSESRLTYDDLPRLAELILANDAVAQLYRNHFAAIVVDEFQDLTPQQLRIVNRIGRGRTTFAGDLAQAIYGFAGAKPAVVSELVRAECSEVIEFAESHRSSPAVLSVVNSLSGLTGGQILRCADPITWPGGGLAAGMSFETPVLEAERVVDFASTVLTAAPGQRIGVLSRTGLRRRFVDAAIEKSGLPFHRWDDGVLDTDTARLVKAMLVRLDLTKFRAETDGLSYLRQLADLEGVQYPSKRENLADALNWCWDLLRNDHAPEQIRARIRIGDEGALLNVPGVHLLTGHIGKGQQFDWVLIVGAEDGCIPDFRAETPGAVAEEARVLSVMISRARHGVLIMRARKVPAATTGKSYEKQASRFRSALKDTIATNSAGVDAWIAAAPWDQIAAR